MPSYRSAFLPRALAALAIVVPAVYMVAMAYARLV
jgi:hypothetical protein